MHPIVRGFYFVLAPETEKAINYKHWGNPLELGITIKYLVMGGNIKLVKNIITISW